MKKILISILCVIFVFSLCGCDAKNLFKDFIKSENEITDNEINEEEIISKKDIAEIIKEYKPNEMGDIPVIMYHSIEDNPPSAYQRSIEGFKKDLAYMYEHDFVTISNKDYIDFNIDIPEGKTPILITFDDGEVGTFDLVRNEDGSLSPRENTAIYLMEEFYKEHPDFGHNAILFINGHAGTFHDSKSDSSVTLEEKIVWLFDNGYEVSNHTSGHLNMSKSDTNEIQKQIATVDKQIKEIKPDAVLNSIAYPFGARPKDADWTITNGSYDGYSYSYQIGFREGPSKPRFYPIISMNFEPMNVPRLRGNEGELGDMWSYFESYEKQPSLRFVSDGDKNTLTVPSEKESLIDYSKLKNDINVIVYDSESLDIIDKENDNKEINVSEVKTNVLY